MDITFKLLDVIIFIGICQGIFLSLTLHRVSNNNQSANKTLSLLIALATLMLIGRFVYLRYLNQWIFQWSLAVDSLVFLFGPLIYTYVKRLLFKEKNPFKLSMGHYFPFFGMLIFAFYFISSYTKEAYYDLYLQGYLTLFFEIISIVMIVFNAFYILRSFQLLKQFKSSEKESFSFEQTPVTYLNFFLFSLSICLAAWTVGKLNSLFFAGELTFFSYDNIWVAIPVFIYVIGYFSLKQPELFRISIVKEKNSTKKDRLSESESIHLQKKLDSLMVNEKVFLQNDLTLADVADKLLTSTNNVSWLLNQVYQTTFYDFINGYRVNEFVKKVENSEHLRHTILALSMDVGFNSKSTFNKAFKDNMKDTPSNFIKKYRAAS
jgi:AraC-like DNA-binding protein